MTAILFLAAIVADPGCRVVVVNRAAYASHQTYAPTAYAATYAAPTYFTASALAYRVEDPERVALVRQNERLTETNKIAVEGLVRELQAVRAEKNAIASTDAAEQPQLSATPVAAVKAILTANCLGCHSGEKFKGGFRLAIPKEGEVNPMTRILVNQVVNAEPKMPPKDQRQLSAEEKKLIAEWSKVGINELKIASK